MRTTAKQSNELLDSLKYALGLRSRDAAMDHLYGTIAPHFKRYGFDLSHYKDGVFTITAGREVYHTVSLDDLFTPRRTSLSVNN